MTKIVDICKYRDEIISLWHKCFGDSEEYITFFLDNCPDIVCVGFFDNDHLVSMLFLLEGFINCEKCKYLYAACTDTSHRRLGIMEKLIRFSESYCKINNYSSIFLVPADEDLYSYYAKFGFIASFYKKHIKLNVCDNYSCEIKTCKDIHEICSIKLDLINGISGFTFTKDLIEYTVREHLFNGGSVSKYHYGNNIALFFYYKENNTIIIKEMLSDFEIESETIIKLFSNNDVENIYIYSPIVYNSADIGEEYTKCGMCLPLNEKTFDYITQNSNLYAGMYLD